jgi:hypothetical protein
MVLSGYGAGECLNTTSFQCELIQVILAWTPAQPQRGLRRHPYRSARRKLLKKLNRIPLALGLSLHRKLTFQPGLGSKTPNSEDSAVRAEMVSTQYRKRLQKLAILPFPLGRVSQLTPVFCLPTDVHVAADGVVAS